MKTLRHTNIKNCQHYFFNSMINMKNFDLNLLSIDHSKVLIVLFMVLNISKIFDDKNSLYLVFNNVDAYIEEYNENKQLVFA